MTNIKQKYIDIGTNIFVIRKAREISQVKLQTETGISDTKLSLIERGEAKDFRVNELYLIADALHVPVMELLMGNDWDDKISIEEKAHRFRVKEFDKEEYRRVTKKKKRQAQ